MRNAVKLLLNAINVLNTTARRNIVTAHTADLSQLYEFKGTYIGAQAYSCPELADHIIVPKNVNTFSTTVFSGVKSKSITINAQITTLTAQLFKNCTQLEYVVLPATLTTMGENVFSGCTALKDIYFMVTEKQWNAIDKTKAALPESGITMHYGEDAPTPPPAAESKVVIANGGSTYKFDSLYAAFSDKKVSKLSGTIEVTVNSDIKETKAVKLPAKVTSVTITAPEKHTVELKNTSLSVKGDLTLKNIVLAAAKGNTALTVKGKLTAENSTFGKTTVTGDVKLTSCKVTGALTAKSSLAIADSTLGIVTASGKTGETNFSGTNATGNLTVANKLVVSGTLTITGKFTPKGDMDIDAKITVRS